MTIRFLATGESQQSLAFAFRVGRQSVSRIISETSEAVYDSLKDSYLSAPKSSREWENIAECFHERWNFPHVIGTIDGKHVRIECPKKSGSLYHNYKGFFSLVLLAVCDSNYCFTMFDIGEYGSNNDCGVLSNSVMGHNFECGKAALPEPNHLPGCSFSPLPFYLLGDEMFPLKSWLIKPYPGKSLSEEHRIYNYRHSRARR